MTAHKTSSSTSIPEAIKLLEEAARDKKEEVQTILTGNYKNLRSLIQDKEHSLKDSLSGAKDSAVETVTDLKDEGVRKAAELGRDVDKNVHEFPWRYIGGGVLAGLVLGLALHRKSDG
ncbi:MAG: hypothetical protein JJU05_16010 [Verrucomicrobia bacterium]|nr:hypothetical protein [Verrucomicrobiota bacterium]MCH8528903.1 hypothetical protein [Kiritimatiellia bacterium]